MAVPHAAAARGEALFARYAYPPNELGHCGPPGADALLAAAGDGGREARERAPRFEGAWAYLRLLAGAAGLGDPLHPDVVTAYWLGGELLDRVAPGVLTGVVTTCFGAQPGVRDRLAALPELAAAGPSHAFHVFVVYPWVGLLGSGDVPRSVLDSCRIRWGTVESVDPGAGTAVVRSRPLTWDGAALALGDAAPGTARWAAGPFASAPAAGDVVSLHWDWVCDRLDDARAGELEDRTRRQLAATNAWLARRGG
jgi:hypothetical protein